MTLYVVVSGYYDEYQIEKIFAFEFYAKNFCEEMNEKYSCRYYRIEKHELEDWLAYKEFYGD